MPRSPSDATRFTSTGPYVSAKPSNASPSFSSNPTAAWPTPPNQINFGSAPANETPQQKIARLRAAAQLARQGKESAFDTTVRVGRIWADRAHRITAISLIGLTVISGAVATAGITDMLLHNRRRRNEWLAEKQMETARDLALAKRALAEGRASEEQLLMINQERVADEAAEAKKNRPGVFKSTTNWLFSGLSQEEQQGGRLGIGGTKTLMQGADQPSFSEVGKGRSAMHSMEDQINSRRRQGEALAELVNPSGGPLDQQAQLAADAASDTSRSWASWITGR